MADYEIDRTAALEAAALLRNLLQAEIPEGDFTEGSAASDLLVDSHAIITGYLRKQVSVVRERQSLQTLADLPASESVADAADAILDNFFRTRRQGTFARGAITLRFAQRQDILVPRSTRFFKTAALTFYIDSPTDLFIPATDLRPDINADGVVVSYSTALFVSAERPGNAYNITPGAFAGFDRFNALLLSVENALSFESGTTVQTTSDFIAKSRNAISLRALINTRSNDAVLLERFSDIESTTTIGYGDPEMTRDLVSNVSNAVSMHVGGHMDIFLRQPIQEGTETLQVGVSQVRNDQRIMTLRHSTVSVPFPTALVVPGDILTVFGLPEAASLQYTVAAVRSTELDVASRLPFSVATDEESTPMPLAYTIGNNWPTFDNKVRVTPSVDVTTSRRFTAFNAFQLPPGPVYAIRAVELLSPPSALAGFTNALTGSVNFTARKNALPLTAPASRAQLGFKVTVRNPAESQSNRAVTLVEIGWASVDLADSSVRITYEAPVGFDAPDLYARDRMNRPACANTLIRAHHPIYLSASIPYRPRTTPFSALSTVIPVFDPGATATALTAYLNAYQEPEPLDVSLLATQARSFSTAIAAIYAFQISYELLLPDGRVARFETEDKVTIFPDATSSARLLNPGDFDLPAPAYEGPWRQLLTSLGVSDRVTRLRVPDGALVFERRA